MIEDLIYWTGVSALLTVGAAVTLFGLYLIICGLLQVLVKELKRSYNHVQLYYFMGVLKEKGYAQAVDDIESDNDDFK